MTCSKKAAKKRLEAKPSDWDCLEKACEKLPKGTICKHIEKKMRIPNMGSGRLPLASELAVNSMTFDALQHPTGYFQLEQSALQEFFRLIRSYGIVDAWDVELLVARYYEKRSYRDIQEQFNYASKSTVEKRLKKIHALLEERGIEMELHKK